MQLIVLEPIIIDLRNPLVILACLFVVLLCLISIFIMLVAWHKHLLKVGRHPALRQMIHQAITLAYKSSDVVFDSIGQRLYGVKKREIAAAVYDMLTDVIKIPWIPIEIKWKTLVTKEMFMDFVEEEYNGLVVGFTILKDAVLKKMLEEISSAPAQLKLPIPPV